jgi:hypothetical protein
MRSLIFGVMALAIEDKVVGVNPRQERKYLKAAKKAREISTPEEIRLLLCTLWYILSLLPDGSKEVNKLATSELEIRTQATSAIVVD